MDRLRPMPHACATEGNQTHRAWGATMRLRSMRHTATQQLQKAEVEAEVLLERTCAKGDLERNAKLKTQSIVLPQEGVEPGLTKLAEVFEAVMMSGAAIEN